MGLNSPVTMDQCVFQVTLMARVVQILLSTSPDLPSKSLCTLISLIVYRAFSCDVIVWREISIRHIGVPSQESTHYYIA